MGEILGAVKDIAGATSAFTPLSSQKVNVSQVNQQSQSLTFLPSIVIGSPDANITPSSKLATDQNLKYDNAYADGSQYPALASTGTPLSPAGDLATPKGFDFSQYGTVIILAAAGFVAWIILK